jgi:hypothetical protein
VTHIRENIVFLDRPRTGVLWIKDKVRRRSISARDIVNGADLANPGIEWLEADDADQEQE